MHFTQNVATHLRFGQHIILTTDKQQKISYINKGGVYFLAQFFLLEKAFEPSIIDN